jgi:2-polyprenyl-3-methyl-5-hydroxy-6-metoxy-1,4-benzoquinol methylase
MAVHQRHGQAPERRLPRDAGPGDTAADDQQIPCPRTERGNRGPPQGESEVVQELSPLSAPDGERQASAWFRGHQHLIRPGSRVLDLACGTGRHSLAAADLGATVLAVDRDATRLAEARRRAQRTGARITWLELDLEQPWPDFGVFDVVLLFHYLDRARMAQVTDAVAPGGVLLLETFLEAQRSQGWGPTSEKHLLRPMELIPLVRPLELVQAREVFEPVDAERWAWMGSALARKVSG